MPNDSPASILFDKFGNPVGVLFDGQVYRLQADARITDGYNILGTASHPVNIAPGDGAGIDSFGRLRISNALTTFDSKQLFDNSPLFWDDQETSGSGTSSTFNANQASTTLAVSNLTAGTRVRQTFRHFNYQPGKGQLIVMTGVLGASAPGITSRLGYFDGYNGVYFEQDGTTTNVVIRSNTSGTPANRIFAQSVWNVDKLDGTGPSGIILDTSKDQIFVIDFQWLGTGRVRFGFEIGGMIVYCHQVLHANINPIVYMSTPNLPLRYEISNDGTGPAASMLHICSAVISEGGKEATGFVLSADNTISGLTISSSTSTFGLLAIRLDPNRLDATVNPLNYFVYPTAGSQSIFRMSAVLNPTVSGTALSWNSIPGSSVQFAIPTTGTTFSGGIALTTSFGDANRQVTTSLEIPIDNVLSIGANIAGTPDMIALTIKQASNTATQYFASIHFRETQ